MARVLSPNALGHLILETEKNVEGQQWRLQLVILHSQWEALLRARSPNRLEITTNLAVYQAHAHFWNHLVERFAEDMRSWVQVLVDPVRLVSREWSDANTLLGAFDEFQKWSSSI
jgi:hypothetical protein